MSAPIKLGDIAIYRIVEQEAPFFEALQFFPKLSRELLEENRGWLQPKFIDAAGRVKLCIQSYVLRTPHHNILVDSCVGNHKPRPSRPFWNLMNSDRYQENLARAGIGTDDIDFVLCTHLHADHVGWNTQLDNGRWVPTFAKARYIFAERELAYWSQRHKNDPAAVPWIADSVLPVLEANRAELVSSAYELNDLVRLVPTPGHTIDHFSVRVGKSGEDAVITGDMIHSPLQARYPELGVMVDYDMEQAAQSRRKLLSQVCDTRTVLCTAHFPSPSWGRIVSWRDRFDFVEGGA